MMAGRLLAATDTAADVRAVPIEMISPYSEYDIVTNTVAGS